MELYRTYHRITFANTRGAMAFMLLWKTVRCNTLGLESALADQVTVVEKFPQQTPPVLEYDGPEPLRKFISLHQDTPLILGARRTPPIPTPAANTNTNISLLTSVGFRSISSEYYTAAMRKLRPDIVVGMADIPVGQEKIGIKRKDKMSDRTETWLRDLVAKRNAIGQDEPRFSIFAPILPIERDLQSWYLEHLLDDMVDHISGLAIYDAYLLDHVPDELHRLPRLSFHVPASPHELLRQIGLGMDLFTIPFISAATDSGIALDFTFPGTAVESGTPRKTLGVDMWHADLAQSVEPISEGCTCYACQKHHRAYIQHLLSAKEMLGWFLIQIHNHTVVETFFTAVRASIEAGTFDADVATFEAAYEPSLPEKTGQGPRVRGYQFRSEAHGDAKKKNPKAFTKFNEEDTVVLKGAHGQQPNKKKEMRDVIDDEALAGLIDVMDAVSMDNVQMEDDEKA